MLYKDLSQFHVIADSTVRPSTLGGVPVISLRRLGNFGPKISDFWVGPGPPPTRDVRYGRPERTGPKKNPLNFQNFFRFFGIFFEKKSKKSPQPMPFLSFSG